MSTYFNVKEKDDNSYNNSLNGQLKRGKSDSNLERLEDLVTDGVCVAGDLELPMDKITEASCPESSNNSGVVR